MIARRLRGLLLRSKAPQGKALTDGGTTQAPADNAPRTSSSADIERVHGLIGAGRVQDALTVARDLSDLHPQSVGVQCCLGHALLAAKSAQSALQAFERAIALQADHVPSLIGHARAARMIGLAEDAVDSLEIAIVHDPRALEALCELAALYEAAQAWPRVVSLLERAVQIEPSRADLWIRLAAARDGCERFDAAVSALERALAVDPRNVAARVNLGMLQLERLGNALEAERLFREALSLDPACHPARADLGLAIQEQGRFHEALSHYEAAIALDPAFAEFSWNRGLAHLMTGNYRAGWADYAARFDRDDGLAQRSFPFVPWNGETHIEGALLVYAEQGLGDEIMFASCLPDLVERGVKVVLECNPRLESMFRRSFPAMEVCGQPRGRDLSWLADYPGLSWQVPIGSLARWLRTDIDRFSRHQGYLQADPRRVAQWKDRLAALGAGLKVGLAWRGGTLKTRRSLKSIGMDVLLPLLERRGVRYVCMQHDLRDEERALLAAHGSRVAVWPDACASMEETGALCAALDVTISVAATTAHLAGALGRPVWILLPASPEWRWRWMGESTPWYPSARLWRQRRSGDWEALVDEVGRGIDRLLAERQAGHSSVETR